MPGRKLSSETSVVSVIINAGTARVSRFVSAQNIKKSVIIFIKHLKKVRVRKFCFWNRFFENKNAFEYFVSPKKSIIFYIVGRPFYVTIR